MTSRQPPVSGSSFRPARARAASVDGRADSGSAVREVLEWLSLVVPIVTIVTALLFWFGYTATDARFAYFGIDSSTLELTNIDYVLRSADGIFVPATVTLLIVLGASAVHALVGAAIQQRRGGTVLRKAATATLVLGLAGTAIGVFWMFEGRPDRVYYLLPPILLGGGVLVFAYSARVLSSLRVEPVDSGTIWQRVGMWAAAAIVLLMVFWTFSLYARALGTGRAVTYVDRLANRPSAIVYSSRSLDVGEPVDETVGDAESYYRYRYSGLRVVIKAGDKYVLLTEGWTRDSGRAILIDDTAEVRLEFEPPREPR